MNGPPARATNPRPVRCGGTLDCGSCPAGQGCGFFAKAGTCGTCDTCASLGHTCGSWSDGCGNTLDCGTCSGGLVCVTSGVCAMGFGCPDFNPTYQYCANGEVCYGGGPNGGLFECDTWVCLPMPAACASNPDASCVIAEVCLQGPLGPGTGACPGAPYGICNSDACWVTCVDG